MNLAVRQSVVDPGIYKLAGEYADYVRAHAIIESHETVTAIGDGGEAYGLLQTHWAFVQEYIPHAGITVHDTFPEGQIKIVAAYYRLRLPTTTLDLVVQGYNLGWKAMMSGERNPDYLARWKAALARIQTTKA